MLIFWQTSIDIGLLSKLVLTQGPMHPRLECKLKLIGDDIFIAKGYEQTMSHLPRFLVLLGLPDKPIVWEFCLTSSKNTVHSLITSYYESPLMYFY